MRIALRSLKTLVRFAFIAFTASLIILSSLGRIYAQETVSDFTLTDIEGNEFSLVDFRGTTVVLSFVATRIIFCTMQVYILDNVSRYFGDDVIVILIGISNDTLWVGGDTDEQLRKFQEDCGFDGIVARDAEGVTEDYEVAYLPTTLIIDQYGYLRHKHVGVIQTGEDLLLEELWVVIPEFSSSVILLANLAIASLIIAIVKSRKSIKQRKSIQKSLN